MCFCTALCLCVYLRKSMHVCGHWRASARACVCVCVCESVRERGREREREIERERERERERDGGERASSCHILLICILYLKCLALI